MASWAVVNIQVDTQGHAGKLTLSATGGASFDVGGGVWHRVWSAAGDQITEVILPQAINLTSQQFIWDAPQVWGQNHQFSVQMAVNGSVNAHLDGDGFKLAGAVIFRDHQNDS